MVKKTKYTVNYINEKAPERIRPKTLVITGLTAITVALISTKLTNTVSSITLVAMASLMTAFFSEGYRLFLETFNRAVRKQLNSTLARSSIQMGDTGEFQVIETLDEPVEIVEKVHSYKPITPFHTRDKARGVLASRWAPTLVFILVAGLTMLGSFGAGSVFQDKNYNVTEVTKTKDISDSRQEQIEANAEEVAVEEATDAKEELASETALLLALQEERLNEKIDAMQTLLLESNVTTAQQQRKIEALEKEIVILNEYLVELEKQNNSETVEPEPVEENTEPEQP